MPPGTEKVPGGVRIVIRWLKFVARLQQRLFRARPETGCFSGRDGVPRGRGAVSLGPQLRGAGCGCGVLWGATEHPPPEGLRAAGSASRDFHLFSDAASEGRHTLPRVADFRRRWLRPAGLRPRFYRVLLSLSDAASAARAAASGSGVPRFALARPPLCRLRPAGPADHCRGLKMR